MCTLFLILSISTFWGGLAFAANGPDVGVAITNGVTSMLPGGTFIYTATVTNSGNVAANSVNVTLNIPLPCSALSISDNGTFIAGTNSATVTWPAFSLGAGSQVLRQIKVGLGNLPAGISKSVVNTASVTLTGQTDINTANNTATSTNTIVANPNLELWILDGLDALDAGATMIYTITAGNQGNIGASGVKITANIPTNTVLNMASISSSIPITYTYANNVLTYTVLPISGGFIGNNSAIFQFQLALPKPLPAGTTSTLQVTAAISDDGANGADSDPSNNPAVDVDTVNNVASSCVDLSIQLSDGLSSVQQGSTMTYTATVRNIGNQTATGVLVKAAIPAYTHQTGAISDGGAVQSGSVVWPKFTLTAGQSVTRQFSLTVDTLPVPPPANIAVTATVVSDQAENNLANNSATDCDAVSPPPFIDICDTTTLNLGTTTAGSASAPQPYMVTGSNLLAPIVITAPAGVELSPPTAGATYFTTLTLSPTGGSVATTIIFVRISATAAVGAFAGTVANKSTGAVEKDVGATWAVTAQTTPAITSQRDILEPGQCHGRYGRCTANLYGDRQQPDGPDCSHRADRG